MPTLKSRPKARKPAAPPFATIGELCDRLGGISPHRICADPPPGTATRRDYVRRDGLSDSGRHCELVDRTMVEKAVGAAESCLSAEIGYRIWYHFRDDPIAFVSGGTYPVELARGLVRSPDVSVTLWSARPDGTFPTGATAKETPALAVEVLSPSNTAGEMARKLNEYFTAGVQVVWLVDPHKFTAAIYTDPATKTALDETGVLTAEAVLPGFTLPLSKVFARLAKPAPKKRKR